jgi:hypothetical protein
MKPLRYLFVLLAPFAILLATVRPVDTAATVVTEVVVPVTAPPPSYDQVDHGWTTPAEDLCWESIAPLRPLADLANAPLVCGNPGLIVEGAAGIFNGVAVVGFAEGWEPAYYRDVAGHELGHAWDYNIMRPLELHGYVMERLGWDHWDQEQWAETWAYCVGQWELGTEWRTPGGTFPTDTDCLFYQAIGAVPILEDER